jgi:TonB family protein
MFEHSFLIEKQAHRQLWIAQPIAVALCMAFLTAIVLVSFWVIDPVQEPTRALIDSFGDEPLFLTAEMTRPEVIHEAWASYAKVARRAGTRGTFIAQMIVDKKGRVSDVRILRGLPIELDRAAIKAIQQWCFKPATLRGRPVKVYHTMGVDFSRPRASSDPFL